MDYTNKTKYQRQKNVVFFCKREWISASPLIQCKDDWGGNDMKDVFFQIIVNCDNNIKDDMGLYVQKDIEFIFSVTIFDSDFKLV